MDISPFFKSIIDQDPEPIVICNLAHDIIYMNPAAMEDYAEDTGEKLIGRSIMDCHPHWANERIVEVVEWFSMSQNNNIIHTVYNEKKNRDMYMVALRSEGDKLIGYYEKHVSRTPDMSPTYGMKKG